MVGKDFMGIEQWKQSWTEESMGCIHLAGWVFKGVSGYLR